MKEETSVKYIIADLIRNNKCYDRTILEINCDCPTCIENGDFLEEKDESR